MNEVTWEPSYVRLSPELAKARIQALCQSIAKTPYDPEEARKLSLGPSAYCYRHLDEAALVAFEDQLNGATAEEPSSEDKRAERNRRYYLKRKERELAS
jgi:hypothetical protein